MRALVSGATGFIGSNLARELLRDRFQVRALVRPGSDLGNLQGLDLELARGDLTQPESLAPALEGCQALFHVAACYTLWHPQPRVMYQVNVQGTENILAAARRAGVERVVYTSTVSTVGVPPGGAPGIEETPLGPGDLVGHYKKSKYLAERVALKFCEEGLPLVVVNPSTPLGPGDIKPTPTGRIVLAFLNGRMPAYINTGLNFVHVRDVARGHILALERGRAGQRYILGHRNMTLRELLEKLGALTGIKAPRLRLPLGLALALAYLDEAIEGRLLRREPAIPVAGVRMARKFMYYDPTKAIQELGLPQTPIEEALEEAVRYFLDRGYVLPGKDRRLRLALPQAGGPAPRP